MNDPRALIAALHEINRTPDRNVARFTASLVGMFGSSAMLELFLDELDTALSTNSVAPPLRQRAANLTNTFIPQVAGFNGINDLSPQTVTADELRAIHCDTPQARREGARLILVAFMKILNDLLKTG